MNRRTVGLEESQEETVERVKEERGLDSTAEAVRTIIDEYREHRERVADLERELEHERARADDLRRQLKETRAREEEIGELVEYVETERSLQERKARAGLVTRAKWWAFGMDDEE